MKIGSGSRDDNGNPYTAICYGVHLDDEHGPLDSMTRIAALLKAYAATLENLAKDGRSVQWRELPEISFDGHKMAIRSRLSVVKK